MIVCVMCIITQETHIARLLPTEFALSPINALRAKCHTIKDIGVSRGGRGEGL